MMAGLAVFSSLRAKSHEPLRLWYDRPAESWEEALPIGNGRLGAMVWGGIEKELIQLNEETLWSGRPVDLNPNPKAVDILPSLPNAWDKGSVKGLRARGGFELGIHWIGRSLQKATVISLRGEPCTLRTTVPIKVKGVSVVSQPELTDFGKWYITTFPTTQGRIYEIQPAISVK